MGELPLEDSQSHYNKAIVRPIGSYFSLDNNEHIINPCRLDLVPGKWRGVLPILVDRFQTEYDQKLHSVWLRGGLPRGLAVDHISDVDTFALIITSKQMRWETPVWSKELTEEILDTFPFIANVETMIHGFSGDPMEIDSRIAMLIKTQSLCISGQNISPLLPPSKIGKDLLLNFRWLEEDLADFQQVINPDVADFRKILKVLLRTGMELVIEREGRFSPDLYLCWRSFSKYYPKESGKMLRVLQLYINPQGGKKELISFIASFGGWILEQVKKELY